MKKYTKRLLAFLLAAIMVLSGVPMSAKEVKAATEPIVLDFCAATEGAYVANDAGIGAKIGEVGSIDLTTPTTNNTAPMWYLTTTLRGENWILNTNKLSAESVDGMYPSDYAYFHRVKGTSTSNKTTLTSTMGIDSNSIKAALRLYNGNIVAFDFEAPSEGEYLLEIASRSETQNFDVMVNDIETVATSVTAWGTGNNAEAVSAPVSVNLVQGTNTIYFKCTAGTGYAAIRAARFEKVEGEVAPTPEPVETPTPEPTEEPVVEQEGFTLEFAKNVQGLNGTKLTAESYGDGWKVHTLGKASNTVTADKYVDIGGLGATTVFEFTAPEKATYDLAFSFESTNGTADADVYVNDAFVGTVKTSKSETADRGYAIPNVNLYGIEYTNTIKFVVKEASKETAPDWNNEFKLRLRKIDFVESDVQVPFPDPTPTPEPTPELTPEPTLEPTPEPTPEPTEPPVVEPEGTVHITASNVDTSTIHTVSKAYYFTTGTRPTEESGENWSLNVEKSHPDTYYDGSEGDEYGAVRYYGSNWVAYADANPLVFNFVVENEGKYNVSADMLAFEKGAYVKVFVDDVYVGTVDGYADVDQSVTQNLLSVDLTAGTHTLAIVPFAQSSGTATPRCKFEGFHFVPVTDASKEITGLTVEIDNAAFDMAEVTTAQITSVVSTTDSDVIYFPTYTVDDENVATVTWKGEVTPVGAGTTNITVTAGEFSETIPVTVVDNRTYTVTWVVGEKEITETYAYGAMPVFKGETAKDSTPKYTYEFTGWDKEFVEVTEDVTYIAQYEDILRTYTITFKNEDGSVIKSEPVAYGEMPTCEDPVKAEDVYATYEFAGWSPEVVNVEGEAIYTATYKATPFVAKVAGVGYTALADAIAAADGETVTLVKDVTLTDKLTVANKVTLDLGGKSLTIAEGDNYMLVVKGDLTIEGEGNVVVTGEYGIGVMGNLTVNGGTFTGANSNGTYIIGNWGTTTLNGGSYTSNYATVNGFAGKVSITGGTYALSEADFEWERFVVLGNVEITGGTFDSDVTEYCAEGLVATENADGTFGIVTATYTITFIVNGEEITATYAHGEEVAVPEVAGYEDTYYTYTFAGWDKEVAKATADATYTAQYAATAKAYAEAIGTNVDSHGTLSVDGNVVTLTVEGDVPYAKSATGVWANWIGFKVTAPEGVDAKNVTILRNDGNTRNLDAIKDGSDPVYAQMYVPKERLAEYGNEYKVDWNSDGEYDLTIVIDTTNANYLTKTFNVTWVVDGVETVEEYVAGTTLTVPVDPAKEGDAQYSYTFTGWSPALVPVVEADATYTAVFEPVVNAYTVTWLDLDGSVLATENYEYGKTPEYKGEASKYGEIKGWSPAVEAVTGDATYTVESDFTGILENVEGNLYYYVAGKMQKNAGLVKVDGKLYYVHYSGKMVAGANQTVSEAKANGLAPAGTYYFKEDGTMQYQADKFAGKIVKDAEGVLWYHVDGEVCKNVGLVKLADGNVYYVHYSGKVVVSGNQTVTAEKANTDKTGITAGTYYFMSNGALKTEEIRLTGGTIIDGEYQIDGKAEKNVGLVKLDGKLYYVHYSGKIVKGSNQTVSETKTNGFAAAGTYYFLEDGSMLTAERKLTGGEIRDGYYYVGGEPCKNVGLVQIGEDLYYVHYSGKVVKGGYQTVSAAKANGFAAAGTYFFDADGKLVDPRLP